MSIPRDWTLTFKTKGDIEVKAYIPPYVWMYEQGHIREVIVQDKRGCEIRLVTALTMGNSSPEELESLVRSYAFPESVCKTCTSPMLAHTSHYRTTDECDTCCKERITAEYKKYNDAELEREKNEETKMKAKGYLFKTVMWVHAGGDDYAIVQFSALRPTDASIQTILRQKRSKVMNDYTIKQL